MASRVIFVVLFSDKLLQSSLVYSIEAYLRPRCVTRVLFIVTRW